MDTTFVKLTPDMSVSEAIRLLLENRITGAAVVDDQSRVVGLLSEKDCLQTLLKGAYDSAPAGTVADYMMTHVVTVTPDIGVFEVTELFLKQVYRRFPVVEDGVLVGQITRRDLLRFIQNYTA